MFKQLPSFGGLLLKLNQLRRSTFWEVAVQATPRKRLQRTMQPSGASGSDAEAVTGTTQFMLRTMHEA
eukprot:14509157-Alexandrium_andersonii.AAC.1